MSNEMISHRITKENGRLQYSDRALFVDLVDALPSGEYTLTISKRKKKRSGPQNAYYWAVVIPMIGKEIGEADAEAVHALLKHEHNYEIKVFGNEELRVPKSTADLTTSEFSEYVERVRQWTASFLSCYIPDPNE